MPHYDYECDSCKKKFEFFQSISEEPKKKCPECGKRKLRRLISGGIGIIFKGSGFYCTDYRNKEVKLPDTKKSLKNRIAETS
jgi:putative FmdB family regulatory protein